MMNLQLHSFLAINENMQLIKEINLTVRKLNVLYGLCNFSLNAVSIFPYPEYLEPLKIALMSISGDSKIQIFGKVTDSG